MQKCKRKYSRRRRQTINWMTVKDCEGDSRDSEQQLPHKVWDPGILMIEST